MPKGIRPERFGSEMPPIAACAVCVHRYGTTPRCAAFPKGIPMEILDGTNRHDKPYPGDNGIQYKRREKPKDSTF